MTSSLVGSEMCIRDRFGDDEPLISRERISFPAAVQGALFYVNCSSVDACVPLLVSQQFFIDVGTIIDL
eukprot:8840735-Prorocentrum_lima.AAC.1